MADEVRLWQVGESDALITLSQAKLNLEERLETWLASDISVLDADLMVIGRQIVTDYGGQLDLLCLNSAADVVVVELKRDKTPRDIVAQVLDYGSWVVDLSSERIAAYAEGYLKKSLEESFSARFGCELPDTVNGSHRLLVVGSRIDESSERIIRYLSEAHGVDINAATFQYFQAPDGRELLARVFLMEPEEVDSHAEARGGSKKRRRLTPEELLALAQDAGVGDLYSYAFSAFESHLPGWHRTRSSVVFEGAVNSRRALLSLIPGRSSESDGLCFQIYKNRLAELTGLGLDEIAAAMPAAREDWTYDAHGGPEWEGFEGFITSTQEIDSIAGVLPKQ